MVAYASLGDLGAALRVSAEALEISSVNPLAKGGVIEFSAACLAKR